MESGVAYSEDPRGEQMASVRVDIAAPREGSMLVPRRGPIGVGHGFSPELLRTIRERVLDEERALGGPASVQWRRYADTIDTFDPRPITAPLAWGRAQRRARLSDLWSRANAGEIMPDVITPFSWSVVAEALESGFHVPWGERSRGRRFVDVFDGYMYFNIGLIHQLIESLGMPGSYFQEAIGGPKPPLRMRRRLDYARVLRSLPHTLRRVKADQVLLRRWPRWRRRARAEAARLEALAEDGAAGVPDRELLRHLSGSAIFSADFVDYLLDVQTSAFGLVQFLLLLSDRWLGSREAALPLIQGLPGVSTAEGDLALWRIAERAAADESARSAIERLGPDELAAALDAPRTPLPDWLRAALRRFLKDYGHRAAGELELAQPRWADEPAIILDTFREYVLHPGQGSAEDLSLRQREAREAAEAEVQVILRRRPLGRWLPLRWWCFQLMLKQTQRMTPLRENPKFELLRVSLQQRRLWLLLGRRWTAAGLLDRPDDVFFLLMAELIQLARRSDDPVIAGQMRSRAARRRLQHAEWSAVDPPMLRDRNGNPLSGAVEAPAEPGAALDGIGASPGTARGRVRIARSAEEGRRLQTGEVLVAGFTDPGWTPIFPLAAAIVTEIGGVLSHGAVVAREFGIPAVVNVPGATERLRPGQLIEVDGTTGEVSLIDESEDPEADPEAGPRPPDQPKIQSASP